MYGALRFCISLLMIGGAFYAGFRRAPLSNLLVLGVLFTAAYIDSKFNLWVALENDSYLKVIKSGVTTFAVQLLLVGIIYLLGVGVAALRGAASSGMAGFGWLWFSLVLLCAIILIRVHESFFSVKSAEAETMSAAKPSPQSNDTLRSLIPLVGKLRPDPQVKGWLVSPKVKVPYFDGVELEFIYMDLTEDSTPQDFVIATEKFLKLTTKDREQAAPHVFKYYRNSVEAVGEEEFDFRIDSAPKVWKHVKPRQIYLSRRSRDSKIYLQIAAECDWEEEHGLQIIYREGKDLSRVSEQDGHLTHVDAYALPDSQDRIS